MDAAGLIFNEKELAAKTSSVRSQLWLRDRSGAKGDVFRLHALAPDERGSKMVDLCAVRLA